MPIIIPRDGGAPLIVTPLTQEQKQQLWARVVSSWAEQHKEELRPDTKKDRGIATPVCALVRDDKYL